MIQITKIVLNVHCMTTTKKLENMNTIFSGQPSHLSPGNDVIAKPRNSAAKQAKAMRIRPAIVIAFTVSPQLKQERLLGSNRGLD